MSAVRMSRALRISLIRADLACGYSHAQIAERQGLTIASVRGIIYDPDGSKQRARRETYRGTCDDCGGVTMSNGTSRGSRICAACNRERMLASRVWTRDAIIVAIQAWAAEHGKPPSAMDWIRRSDDHPTFSNVYGDCQPFASWADAIEAAGFARPRVGYYPRRRRTLVCGDCTAPFEYWSHGRIPQRCPSCAAERRRVYKRASRATRTAA